MDEMAVMERFAFYRGLNEEEAQPYFTLVRDAIAQIEEARRKDIPGGETLLCAAAASPQEKSGCNPVAAQRKKLYGSKPNAQRLLFFKIIFILGGYYEPFGIGKKSSAAIWK
jgi:hypothetical protein